ncbi:MAG: GGDEF domain-containing protein [Pseudomonadota bacterium]
MAVCRENLRATDRIARFGGEEFAILMPETDAVGARRILQRLLDDVASLRIDSDNGAFTIRASAGIAEWQPGDTSDSLLSRADRALYRAKQKGRNRIELGGSGLMNTGKEALCD